MYVLWLHDCAQVGCFTSLYVTAGREIRKAFGQLWEKNGRIQWQWRCINFLFCAHFWLFLQLPLFIWNIFVMFLNFGPPVVLGLSDSMSHSPASKVLTFSSSLCNILHMAWSLIWTLIQLLVWTAAVVTLSFLAFDLLNFSLLGSASA